MLSPSKHGARSASLFLRVLRATSAYTALSLSSRDAKQTLKRKQGHAAGAARIGACHTGAIFIQEVFAFRASEGIRVGT